MNLWNMKTPAAKPTVPITTDAFAPIDHTRLYWLAGAGFMMNARGTILMLDPLLKTMPGNPDICETNVPLKVKYPIDADDVPALDVIMYSHSDDDHLAKQTALSLSNLKPAILGPPPVFEKLARAGVDMGLITTCRSYDKYEYPNVKIEVFPADHPWQLQDPPRCGKPFRADDSVGYIVETPDIRCYLPGDTRLMEEHLRMHDIQFLALDVSLCTYHLNPLGASVLANTLSDAYFVPYHYGTFIAPDVPAYCGDPQDVIDMVHDGQRRAVVTAPGEPIVFRNGKVVK